LNVDLESGLLEKALVERDEEGRVPAVERVVREHRDVLLRGVPRPATATRSKADDGGLGQ
jgi:hypothetical protein